MSEALAPGSSSEVIEHCSATEFVGAIVGSNDTKGSRVGQMPGQPSGFAAVAVVEK